MDDFNGTPNRSYHINLETEQNRTTINAPVGMETNEPSTVQLWPSRRELVVPPEQPIMITR